MQVIVCLSSSVRKRKALLLNGDSPVLGGKLHVVFMKYLDLRTGGFILR